MLRASLGDGDLDVLRRAAGLAGILHQVDQRLLQLGTIEPTRLGRQGPDDAALLRGSELTQKRLPVHGGRLRSGKLRECRIARDELMQMLGALADGGERSGDVLLVPATAELTTGLRHRGDRPEGVVELVAQYPDELLPDRHFLARQLPGQVLDEIEPMRATAQLKHALRKMERLLRSLDVRGEQAVHTRPRGQTKRLRRPC